MWSWKVSLWGGGVKLALLLKMDVVNRVLSEKKSVEVWQTLWYN